MEDSFWKDMRAVVYAGIVGIAILFIWLFWAYYLQFALGYATRPARLNDAQRVEAMSARMNEAYQQLQAAELNVAAQQKKVASYKELYGNDTSTWPQGKRAEFQQDQAMLNNAISAYNTSCARYNGVYADEFRSVAAPTDLPTSCPMMVP